MIIYNINKYTDKMSLLSCAAVMLKRCSALRATSLNSNYIQRITRTSSSVTTQTIHDVNTKVAKDVILFKFENPSFFKYMNIFAIVQYMFWTYLGVFSFQSLRDAPVDKTTFTDETAWFRKINLGENKYRNTLGAIAVIIGTGSLAMVWMYTLKSVRYLILNKGGKHLTFVTYGPFGKNRMMKVPIEDVCCREHRTFAKVQLPLKVKNKMMHYMLDMRGEFKNPLLFDSTAGLSRKW